MTLTYAPPEPVARVQRKDTETRRKQLDRYIDQHYNYMHIKIRGYVSRHLPWDQLIIDDIVQETFTTVLEIAPAQLRNPMFNNGKITPKFWGYIWGIAHNKIRRYIRTEDTERRKCTKKCLKGGFTTSDPDNSVEQEEIKQQIYEVVGSLKRNYQEIISLKYFDEEPYPVVAKGLGINEMSARMRMQRAKKNLRMHFRKRGIDESILLEK